MADYGKTSRVDEDALLTEIRERFDYASREWEDIRAEGQEDMKAVSGDPWPEKDRTEREKAGRVCLSLDELGQYVNQLINEVRQHKRAIQVTPIGNGGDDGIARLRANLIRQIEYRSNASTIAYTSMFENAVQRSYGFLRIKAQYESMRSTNQELRIEPFANPDMVTPDPDALDPTGADMQYCFICEQWSLKDFKRRWPKAKVQSFEPDYVKTASKWFQSGPAGERIQVGEYWTIVPTPRTLLLLGTPMGERAVFADELEPPADDANPLLKQRWMGKFGELAQAYLRGEAPVLTQRDVEYPKVCQYMTNGIELLPPDPEKPNVLKNEWPGTSIPIVACYGKVLWVDEGSGATRKILSLVRLARDPYMLYCYTRTSQYELVGMTPKVPYFVRRGSLKPDQLLALQKSLHEPVAVIEVEGRIDDMPSDQPPEMPVKQITEPPVQALEMLAEACRRAIQAAMATNPLPTQAQRRNEKSGIALQKIEESAQRGSYHFVDHLEMAITRCGAILDEVLPDYYDAARDVTVRTATDATETVRINDPQAPDAESGKPLMLTHGAYDVTLSTGPAMESEREAANDLATELLNTPFASSVADLAVKLRNVGPIGDEIAERLLAMAPPPVQQLVNAKKQSPQMLMAQLQQMQQMVEVLSKELEAKTQIIETEQVKAQQQIGIAEAKANTDAQIKIAQMQTDTVNVMREIESKLMIEMAKLGNAQMMARAQQETELLHQHGDAAVAREEREADAYQADMDRQSARDEAERQRQFQGEQSERDRKANQQTPEAGA